MTAAGTDDLRVVDEPSQQRYEARLGDRVVGFIDYRTVHGRRILLHTEVDVSVEGRGIGGRLVRGALDDVRAQGLTLTVKCPFVAAYLERHPEQRDLLAGPPQHGLPEGSA